MRIARKLLEDNRISNFEREEMLLRTITDSCLHEKNVPTALSNVAVNAERVPCSRVHPTNEAFNR